MFQAYRQPPEFDAQQWNISRRLGMQSGLLALTIIVNILLLYLLQSDLVIGLIVFFLQAIGAGPAGYAIADQLFSIFAYLTVFLIPYLVYAAMIGFPLRIIPHDRPHPPILAASTGITLGLSVAGMFWSTLVAIFFSMFGLMPADLSMEVPREVVPAFLFIVNSAVLPALIEEFTYRGIVLGSLRQYGDRFAVVVSALLFALLHRNMTQFPNALIIGIALGYFMVKTNSIWTSIIIHFINNFILVLLTFYTEQVDPGIAWGMQSIMFLLYIALGCAGLWYFMRVRRLDMSFRPSSCPMPEQTCAQRFFCRFPMGLLLALYIWIIFTSFTRG